MRTPEVRLACARTRPLAEAGELEAWLDLREQEAARRFRFDEDRRSFVIAHALLRALVAHELGCAPRDAVLCHDAKGRPYVEQSPDLHVSLSRSRVAVACAASWTAPVGIDVEPLAHSSVDADLLGEFMVVPRPVDRTQFHWHWATLEAFWKACGTGLADGQSRICSMPRPGGRFDVYLERGSTTCAGRGATVRAWDDCALAVVLRAPVEAGFRVARTDCAAVADIEQLCRADAGPAHLFET